MHFQNILFLSFLFLLACAEKPKEKSEEINEKFSKLVWSDEFDYEGFPDPAKWKYSVGNGCPNLCGWGNNELQYYTDHKQKNARVKNGVLTIEVHEEPIDSFNFSSAKLVTEGIADWKYGRFEINAKLPVGKGIWSAIWMLPTDRSIYGNWPKCGEIDIMENVGFDPDTIVASAHTQTYNHGINTEKNDKIYIPDNDEKFHTYTLEWEPEEYRVYVDSTLFFTFENEGTGYAEWPYDQKFYLILNIAYGGNWGGREGLDTSQLPQKMEIDYVRVYQ